MSDTPETDGLRFPKAMNSFEAIEFLLDHGRRLERDRDRLVEFARNVAETSSSSRLRREAKEVLKNR